MWGYDKLSPCFFFYLAITTAEDPQLTTSTAVLSSNPDPDPNSPFNCAYPLQSTKMRPLTDEEMKTVLDKVH